MKLKILAKQNNARRGVFTTAHGKVNTPAFMTIATTAAIKGLEVSEANDLGAEIILANAYHLELRPGSDLIKKAGGLHGFMNWKKPILTDSGGFQVFSLQKIRKITEEGVLFNSPIDGSEMLMTPESSIQIQQNLGSDIIMAFDECKPPDSKQAVRKSLELTTRWAKRSKSAFNFNKAFNSSLFGIVQGSIFKDLRKQSAEDLVKIGFDGYAIGGLAVGEKTEAMYEMIDATIPFLPQNQPRYLMGVGTPANIVNAVSRGVDLFDCVLPTRNARHGNLYTSRGKINIRQSRYKTDFGKLDPKCACLTCHRYSPAYLRHLFISGELLALPLLVRHNVCYYLNLMREIQESLQKGSFLKLKNRIVKLYR